MPRKTLSDRGVAALAPRATRYAFPDPEMPGLYIRVQPTGGGKSYCAVTNGADGKQVWITVGKAGALKIAEARERAREAIRRVRLGLPAFEIPPDRPATFGEIAASWLSRKVRKDGFRSEREIVRILTKYILPGWAGRAFVGIRRSDVTALMDSIEDEHGARQADWALGIIRSVMNFHAARVDDYAPPLVRGMARQSIKHQARSRILDDDEFRALWTATEDSAAFAGIVRLALLTGQRSRKIAGMKWSDVSDSGEWIMPNGKREKGTAGALVLPQVAIDIIRAQPRVGDNPHVFAASRGCGPWHNWSIAKAEIDAKMPSVPPWQIHDLRRTSRSLLSRAGVRPDIGERVLGHVINGVAGTYDRHSYRDEKADALRRLAALIGTIVSPRLRESVVIPIR
jgi:integrase